MYIIVYRKGFITANNEFEPLDKIYKKFQSKSFKNVPSAVLYLLEIGAILSPLKYQLAVVEEIYSRKIGNVFHKAYALKARIILILIATLFRQFYLFALIFIILAFCQIRFEIVFNKEIP